MEDGTVLEETVLHPSGAIPSLAVLHEPQRPQQTQGITTLGLGLSDEQHENPAGPSISFGAQHPMLRVHTARQPTAGGGTAKVHPVPRR